MASSCGRSDEGKFPALLIVQWAGVYGLDKWWATLPASEGFLVLNISAHDLPIDEQPEFYKAQSDGPLKNYTAIGKDDREKNYFLRMYLSAYRAADYLTQRPDWDGHNLVVTGTSQGGLQTIMLAGLHPKSNRRDGERSRRLRSIRHPGRQRVRLARARHVAERRRTETRARSLALFRLHELCAEHQVPAAGERRHD